MKRRRTLKILSISKSDPSHLLMFASITIGVACILIAGPYFEIASFEGFYVQAPSIAPDNRASGLLLLPNLANWFQDIFTEPYLIIGALGALFCRNGRNPVQTSLIMTAFSYVGLMLYDVSYSTIITGYSSVEFLQDIIANFFGSLILIPIYVTLIWVHYFTSNLFNNNIQSYILSFVAVLGFSIIISFICYIFLFLIYQPKAENLRIISEIPTSGYVAVKSSGAVTRNFAFMPAEVRGSSLNATGKFSGSLSIAGSSPTRGFRAEIYVLGDCANLEDAMPRSLDPSQAIIKTEDLHISFDNDLADLAITRIERARYNYKSPSMVSFWLTENENENYAISNFLQSNDNFYFDSKGRLDLLIGYSLFEYDDSGMSRLQARSLDIIAGGVKKTITFTPNSDIDLTSSLECHALEEINNEYRSSVRGNLLIKIIPNEEENGIYHDFDSTISLTEFNGWIKVDEIEPSSLLDSDYFNINMYSGRNIVESQVGDQHFSQAAGEWYMVMGDLRSHVLDDERILIEGRSDRIWRNGIFLNQSWWDSLSSELKIALIGWMGAVMWFLLKPLRSLTSWAMKPYEPSVSPGR